MDKTQGLPINKKYYIYFFEDYFKEKKSEAKALDYGCGKGEIIEEAVRKGYNFIGVESFYNGKKTPLEYNNGIISRLNPNGVIPYPEGTFDFIYSNQVIEHVEDLNKVLSEMHRVLKNNGVMMHVFPLKRYFIEGHCGIPFMHWLPKNSWFRKKLVRVFYNCGFGHNRNRDTKREEWINTVIDFVDNYCFYRSEQEIVKKFKLKFKIERYEKHKLLYHLSQKKGLTIKFFSCVARLTPGCILSFLRSFQGSIVLVCKK